MWLWITSVLANLYEFTLKSSFVVSMTSFAAGESINYAISLISLFSYLSLDFEKATKKRSIHAKLYIFEPIFFE
jgi:hypothetical protein